MKTSRRIAGIALAMAMCCSTVAAVPAAAADTVAYANVAVSEAAATTQAYATQKLVESSGYKTSYTSRYAYKSLSAAEKKFYAAVVDAVRNLNNAVEVTSGLSEKQVLKVYSLVFHEEPQLFWMKAAYTPSSDKKFLYLSYLDSGDMDELTAKQKRINSTVKTLLAKAKKQSTTYGKLKVFYDYLVLNNEFELVNGTYNASIYGGLYKKENVQCAGYAKSMQYLCDLAGIESMVVQGTVTGGATHAWNVVKVNGSYYNLDVTRGDPINDYGADYIQYEYFLVPDSWIHGYTHFDVGKLALSDGSTIKLFTPPACKKTTYNYFVKNKLNFSSASSATTAMKKQIKNAVKNGKNVAEIRVTSKDIYTKLTSDKYASEFLKYAKSCSSKVKNISKHTTYTQGSFVVHYDINYK